MENMLLKMLKKAIQNNTGVYEYYTEAIWQILN